MFADREEPPYILFICQDETQRDDFLACADRELTGHRWHPSHGSDEHEYTGRRRVLFCNERDAHLGELTVHRLPPRPPGHPARQGHDNQVRRVQLPVGIHSDGAERHGQPQDATSGITVG